MINGPFHFASNLFLFSRGRMVITTRSPTEKDFPPDSVLGPEFC